MTALLAAESTALTTQVVNGGAVNITVDIYTAAERAMLEARWAEAGRDLDSARRHAAIVAGLLYGRLPADLIESFVARWLRDALAELESLDRARDLPRRTR